MEHTKLKENYFLYSIIMSIAFILVTLNMNAQAIEEEEDYNKGVTVSPSRIEFNSEPGKIQTKKIKVSNFTSQTQKFKVVYNDFDISIDGKSSFLEAGTSDYSLSKWVSISPTFLEISPGSAADVVVTVSIPGTEAGKKAAWGVLLIEQAEEKKVLDPGNESGNTVAFGITPTYAFGIWLYQNPPNVANMSVDITNFKYVKSDHGNHLFLDVKNEGDGISFCHAYIELTNLSNGNQEIMGGKKYTILPGYKRSFVFDIPKIYKQGNFSAVGVLDYNSDEELVAAELEFTIE
jgi:hypothetical protein